MLMRLLVCVTLLVAVTGGSAAAQDLKNHLQQYFAGSLIEFGFGGGTSSNNPRIELVIHFCRSGAYFSSGRSCRPNIIAKGYQCSPVQDSGQWQVMAQGQIAALQWVSNSTGPGNVVLRLRGDGVVVDPRGNPFSRIGRAQCR